MRDQEEADFKAELEAGRGGGGAAADHGGARAREVRPG